jgi:peptidoglycan/xylan/chitin deacetylase (PgdA/CDA1 family)
VFKFKSSLVLFLFVEGIIFLLFQGSGALLPVLMAMLVAYLLMLFFFSMNLRCNFFLKAKNHAKNGYVVLGFDDGPDPEMTPIILRILDDYDAKVIFFLIGENAVKHPDIVKEIIKRGHLVGGHTFNHPTSFGFLSFKRTEEEIMAGIKVVERIIDRKISFFRPPFGISNPIIAAVVKKHNLEVVGWNLRSYDTVNKDAQKLLNRITNKVKDGSSILLHDRVKNTVEILPDILKDIQNKKLAIYPEIE